MHLKSSLRVSLRYWETFRLILRLDITRKLCSLHGEFFKGNLGSWRLVRDKDSLCFWLRRVIYLSFVAATGSIFIIFNRES